MKPRKPYQPINRIHPATRWPVDTIDMAKVAKTDVDFVEIMRVSGIDSPELRRISQVAQERLDWAVSKLGSKGKGNPK